MVKNKYGNRVEQAVMLDIMDEEDVLKKNIEQLQSNIEIKEVNLVYRSSRFDLDVNTIVPLYEYVTESDEKIYFSAVKRDETVK